MVEHKMSIIVYKNEKSAGNACFTLWILAIRMAVLGRVTEVSYLASPLSSSNLCPQCYLTRMTGLRTSLLPTVVPSEDEVLMVLTFLRSVSSTQ